MLPLFLEKGGSRCRRVAEYAMVSGRTKIRIQDSWPWNHLFSFTILVLRTPHKNQGLKSGQFRYQPDLFWHAALLGGKNNGASWLLPSIAEQNLSIASIHQVLDPQSSGLCEEDTGNGLDPPDSIDCGIRGGHEWVPRWVQCFSRLRTECHWQRRVRKSSDSISVHVWPALSTKTTMYSEVRPFTEIEFSVYVDIV